MVLLTCCQLTCCLFSSKRMNTERNRRHFQFYFTPCMSYQTWRPSFPDNWGRCANKTTPIRKHKKTSYYTYFKYCPSVLAHLLTVTADDPSIVRVATAGLLPTKRRAVEYRLLGALARQAVHVDGSAALAEVGARLGLQCPGESQLSADDPGVRGAPVGIADGPPVAVAVKLHTAAGERPAGQPKLILFIWIDKKDFVSEVQKTRLIAS